MPLKFLERECHINKKLKAVKTRQIWENFDHIEYELFIRNTIFIKHKLNRSMGLKLENMKTWLYSLEFICLEIG